MKKTKILFTFLIVIVFLLSACYMPGNPSAVVKKAFAAAEKGDWDKFDECTIMSINNVFDFGPYSRSAPEDTMLSFLYLHEGLKNIISESIDGDQSTVKASFKKGNDYDLKLIKYHGEWKIHFSY